MQNLSTNDSKKLIDWGWLDFWMLAVQKYRISKKVRKHLKKGKDCFDYAELADKLGVDRHYIYQVLMMAIKPNEQFLEKLNQLEKCLK